MDVPRGNKGVRVLQPILIVLQKPSYALIALGVTLALLLIASWLPNRGFLSYIIRSDAFSLIDKLAFIFSLKGLTINATRLSLSLLIITAILSGINIALLTYYLKTRVFLERAAGATALGIAGSLIGIGCASCGSVILASLFGFAGSASVIGILPFKGLELGIAGLLLVAFSTSIVARKIDQSLVC